MKTAITLFLFVVSGLALAENISNIITCESENGGKFVVDRQNTFKVLEMMLEIPGESRFYWDNSNPKISSIEFAITKKIYKAKYKMSVPLMGSEKASVEINKKTKEGKLTYKAHCGLLTMPFCKENSASFEVPLSNCEVDEKLMSH